MGSPPHPDPRGRGRAGADAAVADVVGNILMLAVTILLVSALALALTTWPVPDNPVSADLTVRETGGVVVRHVGGEPVPVDGPYFFVEAGGDRERRPLADFASDVSAGSPSLWELGEEVCLHCQTSDPIDAVTLVAADRVILDWVRAS